MPPRVNENEEIFRSTVYAKNNLSDVSIKKSGGSLPFARKEEQFFLQSLNTRNWKRNYASIIADVGVEITNGDQISLAGDRILYYSKLENAVWIDVATISDKKFLERLKEQMTPDEQGTKDATTGTVR